MRNTFACFLLSVWLVPNTAITEPISIRSGDHDGFTRLVMQLPPTVQWEVSSAPGRKTISFLGHKDGFDVSGVFDIIPRNQLTNVTAGASSLELELSCDCETQFFVEQGNYLVVDIVDGSPLPLNNFAENPIYASLAPKSNFAFGELLWSNLEGDQRQIVSPVEQQGNDAHHEASNISPLVASVVEDTRERLLRGVADAASRNLIQPSLPRLEAPTKEELPQQTYEIFDSSTQTLPQVRSEIGNLRITNSRDTPNSRNSSDLISSSAVCPSADSVQVSTWGDDRPFHEQVSLLRDSLYSETDRLNEKVAIALSRLYIFFGFGVEAKQILRLSESLVQSNPELMDLADIVDFGFTRNPRSIHRFSNCDSDLSLWAIMAASTFPEGRAINENAALRALVKLPSSLRDYIAPVLSKRFIELGKTEAASIALRRVSSGNIANSPNANLAKAKLEQNAGNLASADVLLAQVSQANSVESPEALVEYVEAKLLDLAPVDADVSLLIEAYSFEFQDSALGLELSRAHILASALSGQFDKAFEALRQIPMEENATFVIELHSNLFSILTKTAGDLEFLNIVFSSFPANAEKMHPQSIMGTAKRMNHLGFTFIAQDILESYPRNDKDMELSFLEAEIYLNLDHPEEALDVLQMASGAYADELRARALLALGENSRAMELFQAANMSETAKRAAWLSEDWIELTPHQSTAFGGIRNLAEDPVPRIKTEDGMIAATQNALEESASARGILADLLQSVQISREPLP